MFELSIISDSVVHTCICLGGGEKRKTREDFSGNECDGEDEENGLLVEMWRMRDEENGLLVEMRRMGY